MYHVEENLQQKALDSNKVPVVPCAQVYCKLLFFWGEKNMRFDWSISGPVQAKVCPASFSIVSPFVPYTHNTNFTSFHLVISKLECGWMDTHTHTQYPNSSYICAKKAHQN